VVPGGDHDLLVTQGHHGIDARGSTRGDIGCEQCDPSHKRADPQLRVRLLVVDFESLTEETFEEIKANMDLRFADMKTEKRLATERLAFARELSSQITFTYRLLPINVFPAMKLRLYERCGFFYFYHTDIAGKRWAGKRSVFCVDVPRGESSPLLETLRQMYNHLWDKGRNL
jgi:hypothetical protein